MMKFCRWTFNINFEVPHSFQPNTIRLSVPVLAQIVQISFVTNLLNTITADQRGDTGAEKRYMEIVQRRKLVDLAKAQAQEVAVLRAEVERLRMRTFPALVQVEH